MAFFQILFLCHCWLDIRNVFTFAVEMGRYLAEPSHSLKEHKACGQHYSDYSCPEN